MSASDLFTQFINQMNNYTTILDTVPIDSEDIAVWSGRTVVKSPHVCSEIKKIQTEHQNGINKMSDKKLVERICSFCNIGDKDQKLLNGLSEKSPRNCAIFLKDLIVYKSNTEKLPSNPFYHGLHTWVTQGDGSENRAGAANAIIESYQSKIEELDLDNLGLNSLPDVLKELPHLCELSCAKNKLTTLPDVFDHLPNLSDINLSENLHLEQFPINLYRINRKLHISLEGTQVLKKIITPTLKENITQNDWSISDDSSMIQKEYALFEHSKKQYLKDTAIAESINLGADDLTSKQQVYPSGNLNADVQKMLLQKESLKLSRIQSQQDLKKKLPSYSSTKLRLLPCGSQSASINVFGCKNPKRDDRKDQLQNLSFIYDEIDTIISLTKRDKKNEPTEILRECAGANDCYPIEKVVSMPIKDFMPPRLEHYLELAKEMSTPRSDEMPKGLLIFCGYGEGRTGTLMAAAKAIDEFKKLDNSSKKQLLSIERDLTPDTFDGSFSRLHDDFKTTTFVGKIVHDLRKLEQETISHGVGVSVETPAQFQTLELLQVMLAITEKLNDTPKISDAEIIKIINEKNFPQDTLDEFFQINHNHQSQEKVILDAIKQLQATI